MHCCNCNCNQGRDCPVKVAKVGRQYPRLDDVYEESEDQKNDVYETAVLYVFLGAALVTLFVLIVGVLHA
jgi:uncharacterized membrane protein